jgi:3-hydroxy acid dehydrogenase / malonic semialdehyde reductase
MSKMALITGATSGIGMASARILAKNGYSLIITGRRDDRLTDLKQELISLYNIKVLALCFDVRSRKAVEKAIAILPSEWKDIDVLVNNAGLAAGLDPIHQGSVDDWDQMIDTNLKGLLYVTRMVLPGMVERKQGHIINISSIAGHDVYEKGNVYNASKHAVEALSKAMRIDLVKDNIKVSALAPGFVETEFSVVRFHGDKERAKKVYEGMVPLNANDVAEALLFIVTRPDHVCINEMLIMPTAQANGSIIYRKF